MSDLKKKIGSLSIFTDALNDCASILDVQEAIGFFLSEIYPEGDHAVALRQRDQGKVHVSATDPEASEMAVSIHVGDDVYGVLRVATRDENPLNDADLRILQIVADVSASRVESITTRTHCAAQTLELKARSDRHEIIHRVGQTLAETETLKDAMQKVVDIVSNGLQYARTAVLLVDTELEELECISASGYGDVDGLTIPISKGATGYSVRHGEPVNIPDVTTDPRYVMGVKKGRSELVVPIMGRQGVRGVIDVESTVMNAFDAEDIHLLEIVASYASAAIGAAACREALAQERGQRK